jgi:anti-sigma factor RsiW
MERDRIVAGLHCGEVLADLTEYLDGLLQPERMRRIQEHVAGCDLCASFGSELAVAVQALRESLREPARDAEVEARLLARLREEVDLHE